MEPVKTCVTCKHSLVARLHPADWFKRRLCGHPGMVDRVEGKPLNACDEARQAEQPCGIKGGLWDGVEVVRELMPVPESRSLPPFPGSNGPAVFSGDAVEGLPLGPGRVMVYPDNGDAVKLSDPIDLAMRLRPRGRE